MRICFVAPANNYHTKKWASWFLGRGHEIHVVSFIKDEIPGVAVHYIDTGAGPEGGDASKLKYLLHAKDLKKIVDSITPDIVNVHYATSYGTVAALSGIKPYVLSVWGSDIYDFPKKSPLHKAMLKYSLRKAAWLFSTSKAMAKEGSKYTNKKFEITPFGVDMKLFNPDKRTRPKHVQPFTIGIAKTMADLYGIEYIIKAVAIVIQENNDIDLMARISGDSQELEKYRKLTVDLGISDRVHFFGRISQESVAEEWANMDVAVIPSILYESFGVSAVEAQASETPVVIPDVDVLKGETLPNKSSIIVQDRNERAIADTIIDLYRNPQVCSELGANGRKYVTEKYELNSSSSIIEALLTNNVGVRIRIDIVQKQEFVVGTVKGLSDKYGIADILNAVSIIKKDGYIPIKLRIAGKGPQEDEYKALSKKLEIDDITTWLGFISQKEAAKEWANMDVGIIPSTLESESFGVSAIEAQACGTALIISDIPGLMEATKPGESSLVVHRNNPVEIADMISLLYSDYEKLCSQANAGREFVREAYEIDDCFENIERLFEGVV